MKYINIIHFGIGNVGKTFIKQVFANKQKLKENYGIDFHYCGLFNSKGGFFNKEGFSEREIKKYQNLLNSPIEKDPNSLIKKLSDDFLKKTIIIDTTTSSEIYYLISSFLKKGTAAVFANKRPFSGKLNEFKFLDSFSPDKVKYETTVGAGLPVIKVLKEFIATGDDVLEINGCFSGTLGFILSSLENGETFSKSIILAKEKGFTESDPREDLSGNDVSRKAVILARIIGNEVEFNDLNVSPLYPKSYEKYSVADFIKHTSELNEYYKNLFKNAEKKQMTLRFVAHITKKECSVKLTEVNKNSSLGNLNGPNNMIIFKTKRYFEKPVVISGPGAGAEVTAAGVFGDILSLVNAI